MAEVTETIYARVPVDVKQDVEAYASEHGKKLAGAVAELLKLGLQVRAAGLETQPVLFTSAEEWCAEALALLQVESVSKLLTQLGHSIISGQTSDIAYYRRARVMMAQAVTEWALTVPQSKFQGSDNG